MFVLLKKLMGDSFVYGLTSILSRFIGFLLLPLYTRILTPADYGVLNIVNTTVFLLTMFVVLALDSASGVFFWDKEYEKNEHPIFASWFWCQLTTAAFFAALLAFLAPVLSEALFKTRNHAYIFRIAALILPVSVIPTMIWNWFRLHRRVWSTTIFVSISTLLQIGLTVYFIAYTRVGTVGFFWAQVIANGLMSLIGVFYIGKIILPKYFNKELLKKMLRFSLPMIPAALAFWLLNSANSYFLQVFKGEKEVGLYQIALNIASIMSIVISSFTQAWGPFAFSIKENEGSNNFYANVFLLYTVLTTVMACLLGLFSTDLLKLITTPAYYDAAFTAGLLAFNTILGGLNYIAALGLNFVKNMKPYSMAIIGGGIVNALLMFMLIPYTGKEGAAVIMLVCNIGITSFIFYQSQKRFFIPYAFRKAILFFGLGLGLYIIVRLVKLDSYLLKLGISVFLLLMATFTLRSELKSLFIIKKLAK